MDSDPGLPDPRGEGSSRPASASLPAWLAVALWVGLGWGLLRARTLVSLAGRRVDADVELAEWTVAAELSREAAAALSLALLATGLVRLLLRRGIGAAATCAVALTSLTAGWLALTGGPWSPAQRLVPLLELSAKGPLPSATILLGAAAAHALPCLALAHRGAPAARARPKGAGTPPLAARAALVLALVAVAFGQPLYRLALGVRTPRMTILRVEREVLREPHGWEVERSRPDAPPRAAVLSPSTDFTVDGADQPALVMSPPCALSFRARDGDGTSGLRLAAGVDLQVYERIAPDSPRVFGFAVEVDGERVFVARIAAHAGIAERQRRWERPPERSVPVPPGARVRLETWIEGQAAEAEPAWEVGFAELLLESSTRRDRLRSSPRTPNLVLVVQDTLRTDRLSSYAYEKPSSPNLDRLAARGTRYEQAFATSSWTWPSTASILTGLYPERHGVTDDSSCYLACANQSVAEALQERGYTTAAFTCNPLVTAEANFHQGFETFDGVRGRFRKTDEIWPRVRRWLDRHAGTRFFLYLHLVDPHAPYDPRPEELARLGAERPENWTGDQAIHQVSRRLWRGAGHDAQGRPIEGFVDARELRYWNELYDASVATGDWFLGRVLDRLEELDLDGETIVVFTSDHGEEWLDHGLLTHGQSLHRELVHVPLVLAGPGIPRGVVCGSSVSNRHIAPTLARLGGAELTAVEGACELWAPQALSPEAVFFSTMHGWWNARPGRQAIHGLREGRWVFHHAPEGGDWKQPRRLAPAGGQVRLYDIERDPHEHLDLAAERPEVVRELGAKLAVHLERQRAARTAAGFGAGSATMRMLGEIGYAGGDDEALDSSSSGTGEDGGG